MDGSRLVLALLGLLERLAGRSADSPTVEEFFNAPPSHETVRRFGENQTSLEEDLQSIFALLRKLIDGALRVESPGIACMGPELDKVTILIKPLALVDMRVAAYMVSLFSNLAAMKESRAQLNAPLVWDFVKAVAQRYIHEHDIFSLVLVVMSNVACLDDLKLTRKDCEMISRFVFPIYTKAWLVEAWATMLCNITAYHPETRQVFVELGVVEVLERLVLYVGEEGKTALRGMQCLANLATGFTNGHVPALME